MWALSKACYCIFRFELLIKNVPHFFTGDGYMYTNIRDQSTCIYSLLDGRWHLLFNVLLSSG